MSRRDRREDMDRLADTIEAVIPPRESGKQWLFSLSHVGETVEIAVPGRDEDDPEAPPRYEAFAEAFREETDEPWPHPVDSHTWRVFNETYADAARVHRRQAEARARGRPSIEMEPLDQYLPRRNDPPRGLVYGLPSGVRGGVADDEWKLWLRGTNDLYHPQVRVTRARVGVPFDEVDYTQTTVFDADEPVNSSSGIGDLEYALRSLHNNDEPEEVIDAYKRVVQGVFNTPHLLVAATVTDAAHRLGKDTLHAEYDEDIDVGRRERRGSGDAGGWRIVMQRDEEVAVIRVSSDTPQGTGPSNATRGWHDLPDMNEFTRAYKEAFDLSYNHKWPYFDNPDRENSIDDPTGLWYPEVGFWLASVVDDPGAFLVEYGPYGPDDEK